MKKINKFLEPRYLNEFQIVTPNFNICVSYNFIRYFGYDIWLEVFALKYEIEPSSDIQILLPKFLHNGPIGNKSALIQVINRCRIDDKPW